MSQNPAHPDAHPTAPGGMSMKALIKELVDKHGYESDPEAWAQVKWTVLIDMVIAERRDREATPAGQMDAAVEAQAVTYTEPVDSTVPMGEAFPDATPETARAASDMFDRLDEEELPDGVVYDDPACQCGTEESAHDSVDPPHMFTPHGGSLHIPDEMGPLLDEDNVMDPEMMFAEMAAAREEATPPPLFIGLPGVKDYIFDNHAGAGPSGAERWMNCTMSLTASREFLETLSPNQQRSFATAGTAAAQGTTAHSAAEVEANLILGRATQEEVDYTLLELSVTPEDEGEAYDDEMAEYIIEYTDLVKSYAQERGDAAVLIEARVEAAIPLTDMHEGEVYVIRGSADLAVLPTVYKQHRTLVVGDLKYGEGIDVGVDENPQIRTYALGVLELLADPETGELPADLDTVVYHIVQPRLGGIKTSTESIDDLLEWRDEVLAPALTKALYGANEGATFEPSELACQWCPARGGCPALAEQRIEEGAALFDAVVDAEFEHGPGSVPDPVSLSNDRLGELLAQAKAIKDLYSDMREEAQRRLHRGDEVPGYWLVNYSPNREWEVDAAEALTDVAEVWTDPTPALLSPAQAEKALGKEKVKALGLAHLIHRPDKRPVISTGLGDKRSKWDGKPPEQMFAVESELEEEA